MSDNCGHQGHGYAIPYRYGHGHHGGHHHDTHIRYSPPNEGCGYGHHDPGWRHYVHGMHGYDIHGPHGYGCPSYMVAGPSGNVMAQPPCGPGAYGYGFPQGTGVQQPHPNSNQWANERLHLEGRIDSLTRENHELRTNVSPIGSGCGRGLGVDSSCGAGAGFRAAEPCPREKAGLTCFNNIPGSQQTSSSARGNMGSSVGGMGSGRGGLS